MGTEGEPGTLPDVIRLRYAGRCGCGRAQRTDRRAVTPVLCFIDGSFPSLETKLRVASTLIVGPKGLTRLVATLGPLNDEQRYAVYYLLGQRLASMT